MSEPQKNSRPIGIFDSGIGGLTVFAAIKRKLPNESLIYLGDTARVPYGTKSAETVVRYSKECAAFLVERGVKAIVVACNTATSHALPALAAEFNVPILGVVEPGAAAAIKASKSKVIGVIATKGTIASNAYGNAIKRLCPEARVVSHACQLFVSLAEEGWIDDEVAVACAKKYLSGMRGEGIDTLILGCTHYPLLGKVIANAVGLDISLVDSAETTAAALKDMLAKKGIESVNTDCAHRIYVTDLPAQFELIAQRFLGTTPPQVTRVDL